jgi:hypothetical protein
MSADQKRRKRSEAAKRGWETRRARAQAKRKPAVHIFHGRAARSSEPEDRCMYCDRRYAVMAYTYFGAPVCGYCWDRKWRKGEDGEHDPPFSRIKTQVSGEWLR